MGAGTRPPLDLRPRSVGELLDRAITLCVRNSAMMIAIWAVVYIPLAITSALIFPMGNHTGRDLLGFFARFAGGRTAAGHMLTDALFIAAESVANLLGCSASVIVLVRSVQGMSLSLPGAYRAAVTCWLRQPVLCAGLIAAGMILHVLVLALIVGAELVVYVPVAFFRWPDGLVAIPVTLTYVVIFVACSLVVLAFWLTIIAAAPGECSGWEALVLGWRRVFSRGLVRRTVLVASLALAIEFASSTVFALIGSWLAVATATRSWSSILTWSGAAAQAGLLCAFFVLYSLDVRIRREGFDLAVAAGLDRS